MSTAIEQALSTLSESEKTAFIAAIASIPNGLDIDPVAAAERNRTGKTSTESGPVTNLQNQLERAAKTAERMGATEFASHIRALEMLAELLRSADDVVLCPPNLGCVENSESAQEINPPVSMKPRVVVIRQRPVKALCKKRDAAKAGTLGPTINLLRKHIPNTHYSQIHAILQEAGCPDASLAAVKSLWRQSSAKKG